ncbi:MAG: DUF2059 domain-containing protein [Alphaproteobacteria bacterium]
MSLTLLAMTAFVFPAKADDFARRLELAEKMLEIRPAKVQLESAVDSYIGNYLFTHPEKEQQLFRTAVLNVMNPKALEKLSIDAYAETFTLKELESMVEYYSKPEAQSAREKQAEFNRKVAPEIVKMLDQALMKARTESKIP